ncbi:MAG: ATP-dependent DNA helicase [Gammaproteobacteria bacterium]|nr:ATP-dependent DNA helicase [Gammaproteobacteria bacterium]
MTSHARFLLSKSGPFAQMGDSFREREAQMAMSEVVEQTMEQRDAVMIEAGTGTGKTFAYLVPAIELDGKTIVSTGTRNLQDQLFFKDLPYVFRVMSKTRKVALLKGRQNYLCLHRLDLNLHTARFTSAEVAEQIVKVNDWRAKTRDGDLTQFKQLPEDAGVLPYVTSTADNCLGSECPDYNDCFVAKARKQAMDADIVVVNHHLLMADLALKEDGFGELLPRADAYVVDEAHQLPDVASAFFGKAITSRQINELSKDVNLIYRTHAADCKELETAALQLEKLAADFRISLGEDAPRQFWRNFSSDETINEAYQSLVEAIDVLCQQLKPLVIRDRELENLYERSEKLLENAELFVSDEDETQVRWIEVFRKSFILNATPLDVSEPFQKSLAPYRNSAWVLTSATLAVNGEFNHFKHKLGLFSAKSALFQSPFTYREQALLYVPRWLKNPSSPDYTRSFVEAALPLLKAARGRAFLLFTSHRALNEAAQLLENHREFNLFVQGDSAKTHLLESFRKTPDSVLLGTFSFWEGVDVAGEALSFVAIDKLPFSSPGDPVNQARIESLKRQGKDAFGLFQLPDAVIALKQGAGRLIRGVTDKGVLMVGDPRLISRQYGKRFIEDLPPMLPTRNQEVTEEFLSNL